MRTPSGLLLLALALLAATPARAEPPPRRSERVLADLASGDAARRRIGLADLAPSAAIDPPLAARALPALREILRLRAPEERAEVARCLGGLRQAQAVALWLDLVARDDEDERVLLALMEGLGTHGEDPPLAAALLEAASQRGARSTQRALALEALGALGGPEADLRLKLERPGADWVEESGRVLGLGRRGGPAAIGQLIELLGHDDICPRVHAAEELRRLTQQAFGPEQPAWEAWWLAERARRGLPTPPAPPEPVRPDDRYAQPESGFTPRFYGIPVPKRGAHSRVVFCCDVSQSMYGFPLDRSRRELTATLKSLTLAHRFDVIGFNENVLPWAGRLVRAHPVQKVRAIDWFLGLEPTSYTNLYDAVETAFGYAGRGRYPVEPSEPLDAVFLLTDGEPNRGRYREAAQVVKAIKALSEPGVPVHTIGAGEAAVAVLKDIARVTGGTFVDAFE